MKLFGIYSQSFSRSKESKGIKLIDVVKAETSLQAIEKSKVSAKGLETFAVSASEYEQRAEQAVTSDEKRILKGYAAEIKRFWNSKK
jgi:hypothetical protein